MVTGNEQQQNICSVKDNPAPVLPEWVSFLPPSLRTNPGIQTIALQAASMGCISFKIPRSPYLVSGRVLKHCIDVLQGLFLKHEPLIFKLGYTHDPCWRWKNDLYGYCHAREKYTDMTVLWVSDEPHGPAMLEASLIEMFKSI